MFDEGQIKPGALSIKSCVRSVVIDIVTIARNICLLSSLTLDVV